ncbi:MAG: ABC transporter substrate-binding protein [Clostridium sp.]
MKKRFLSLTIAAIMSATLFSGCQKNDKDASNGASDNIQVVGQKVDGGTFIYPIESDVSSLNIWYETGDEGFTMLKPIYDPLFITSATGTRYYLAESYEVSDDGLSILVKLRQNAKWHDGEAITADDLIFTFDIKNNPDNKVTSGTSINRKPVTYEKVDDYSVKFTLPEVAASYISTLGNLKIIPKHIYEGEASIATSEKNMLGIGSGPYKVEKWQEGTSLSLIRFEDYYRGVPNLENVVFKIIPEFSAQEVALQSGEISVMRIPTSEKLDKYSKDERYNIWNIPEGRNNYLGFNSNSEKMKDIKARQAITMALNCDEIIAGVYGEELAVRGENILNPENIIYDESVKGYEQDVEGAKKLIAELGLDKEPLKLVYNSSRVNMEDCALIIQQQLKEVGITVEITGYETQGFFDKFFYTDDGTWDLGLNGYASNADPNGNNGMFQYGKFLTKNVCTSEATGELWAKGDQTIDEAERKAIYSDIEKAVKEEYTIYPISMPNFVLVADKKFQGLDAIKIVPVFEDYLQLYMTE